MELFEDKDYYIIRNGDHALWCSRSDGSLTARSAKDFQQSSSRSCLGIVYGVIGKLKISPDSDWRLLLVKQQTQVGTLPRGQDVYKIVKVLIITLGSCSVKDLDIEPCPEHQSGKQSSSVASSNGTQQKPLQRTWNQFKQAAENIKPKKLGFKIPPLSELVVTSGQLQKEMKEKEKFERRVLEELGKMFNESESFYYCPNGDITNCIQRQQTLDPATPFWQRADDRFFWNKYMLQDLINSKSELCRPWLIPIIQGYVQIEVCQIAFDDEFDSNSSSTSPENNSQSDLYNLKFKLCLISRRSRHRAGTRYKRRGVDDEGNTANYVETEQILEFTNHIVSFVQVRGSVPLYWGQTGIKYKPPPRIYRDEEQNHKAFCRHFEEQLQMYKTVTAVSLVDQLGKEKVICDTFLRHIITYNSPQMTYVAFDFHEYCRGMRFENISVLTENIMDIIQSMGYCWVDENGTICEQRGVFRVNCIDCLDRTNIVQSALARIVLEVQCRKLGLLSPERPLPPNYRTIYQQMWANNGDIISCQYAGTAALKGDYTRTGERRLAGMMKDGVNSANRYYINRVKDVYRQATVNLMLGNTVAEDFDELSGNRLEATEEPEVLVEKEENLKTLIDECKKMLITEADECLGGWGLINCDQLTGDIDPSLQDMDIILLLSQKAYYVAHYDDDTDHVTSYQKILLTDLDKIEIGVLSFGSKIRPMCIRVFYRGQGSDNGYFHTFCTTSTRLFNNIVVEIRNQEEARESLRAICETFLAAKKLIGQELTIVDTKLDKNTRQRCSRSAYTRPRLDRMVFNCLRNRHKSRPHVNVVDIASEAQVRVESSVRPKANVSRDSTSENLVASAATHETAVTKLIHLTGNSSSKLSTFGRAMAGMLPPVKKMRLNQMFPSVLYRKGNVPTELKVKAERLDQTDGSEKIAIQKEGGEPRGPETENEMRVGPVEEDGRESLKVYSELLSSSDSELSGSELDLTTRGHDSHFVLRSTGLLAVSPQQIVLALLKNKAAEADMADGGQRRVDEGLEGVGREGLLERKKALFLAQAKSRSLDVEERGINRTKPGQGSKAISDIQVRESQFKDVLRKKAFVGHSDEKRCGVMVRNAQKVEGESVATESPQKDVKHPSGTDASDGAGDFPAIVINDREMPIHQPLIRRHSLLKISHSEGSLSSSLAASQENVMIDLDELDLFDSQGPGGSTLMKLRIKMANLALPAMGMPENRHRQLRELAKNNRLRSQLRFRELKTRVILL